MGLGLVLVLLFLFLNARTGDLGRSGNSRGDAFGHRDDVSGGADDQYDLSFRADHHLGHRRG